MSTLATSETVAILAARVARLTPDTPRRWGTMTAHEMLCHLADSFRCVMGERYISLAPGGPLKRRLMRLVALHTPLPWPKGIRTRPEVDPRRKGTRPESFELDRQELLTLLRRFTADDATYAEHPMFGAMSRDEWLIWGYRHVDHHLRQFGL